MEFNIEMLLMGQNTNNSWLESIGADVSSFKKDIKNTRVLTGVIVKQLSELETKEERANTSPSQYGRYAFWF
jgi:hypothetical protein